MASDPPDPNSMDSPSWEPPRYEPELRRRNTFGLAMIVVAVWMASAFYEFFVVYLMRRRTAAWRTVLDAGGSQASVSQAQLADEQLLSAVNRGWALIIAMFVIGAFWVYGAAMNAVRSGAPDVNAKKIAVRFAIPIIGIPFALREMIRIMVSLRHSGRHLAQWLNSMFVYFFIWLGTYALQLVVARRSPTDDAILDRLQLEVSVTAVRAVAIAIITALAVRAILHTDRTLRSGEIGISGL